MAEGGVVIAPISDLVPAEVKAEAEALMASITDKSYHPFTGPLNKQDGTPFLKEGEVIDDGTLAGMAFYVEGVEGAIPS
jgi:simple sugar transport system substrate-binding protein